MPVALYPDQALCPSLRFVTALSLTLRLVEADFSVPSVTEQVHLTRSDLTFVSLVQVCSAGHETID